MKKPKLIKHQKGYWYSLDDPTVHIPIEPELSLKDKYLAKLRDIPEADMPFRLAADLTRRVAITAPFVKFPVK